MNERFVLSNSTGEIRLIASYAGIKLDADEAKPQYLRAGSTSF